MLVGLVCYSFLSVRTRTSECSMTGRFADAYSESVRFFCSNPVNSPTTMKVHSSHICSRRDRNLQYERRMCTPRKEHSDDPSQFLVLSHQSEVESMER